MKLFKQPCDQSCILACLVMITGISFLDISNIIDTPPSEEEVDYILDIAKSEGYIGDWERRLYPYLVDGYNMIVVPSLNIIGDNHMIVVHTSDGGKLVFDPNQGRKDKKFYVSDNEDIKDINNNACHLKCWNQVIHVNL